MAGRGLQTPNLARNSNGFPFIQVSRTRSYMEYCMSFGILSIDKFPFPRSTLRSCPAICGTIVDCRMMCGWPPNKRRNTTQRPCARTFHASKLQRKTPRSPGVSHQKLQVCTTRNTQSCVSHGRKKRWPQGFGLGRCGCF